MPSYFRIMEVPGWDSQRLYEKVSQELEILLGKISIGKCDISQDVQKKEFRAKASMFSAVLVCRDGSLELNAKLSLLASPFRSKVDEVLDRWVKKTFQT